MMGISLNNDLEIKSENDLIHSSIERLFFGEIESMIGGLNKGSRLLDYMYEPLNEKTAVAILNECRDLIDNYEPRIELQTINVEIIEGPAENGLIIHLEFNKIQTPDIIEDLTITKVYST